MSCKTGGGGKCQSYDDDSGEYSGDGGGSVPLPDREPPNTPPKPKPPPEQPPPPNTKPKPKPPKKKKPPRKGKLPRPKWEGGGGPIGIGGGAGKRLKGNPGLLGFMDLEQDRSSRKGMSLADVMTMVLGRVPWKPEMQRRLDAQPRYKHANLDEEIDLAEEIIREEFGDHRPDWANPPPGGAELVYLDADEAALVALDEGGEPMGEVSNLRGEDLAEDDVYMQYTREANSTDPDASRKQAFSANAAAEGAESVEAEEEAALEEELEELEGEALVLEELAAQEEEEEREERERKEELEEESEENASSGEDGKEEGLDDSAGDSKPISIGGDEDAEVVMSESVSISSNGDKVIDRRDGPPLDEPTQEELEKTGGINIQTTVTGNPDEGYQKRHKINGNPVDPVATPPGDWANWATRSYQTQQGNRVTVHGPGRGQYDVEVHVPDYGSINYTRHGKAVERDPQGSVKGSRQTTPQEERDLRAFQELRKREVHLDGKQRRLEGRQKIQNPGESNGFGENLNNRTRKQQIILGSGREMGGKN